MERKILAEEIVSFCIEYKIKGFPKEKSIAQSRVEEYLQYDWFIENLIQTLLLKTKYIKNIDNKKLEALLAELEKVRLDLEYN